MEVSAVDTRALVNAFPLPAMLIDEHHRVVDANMLMVRETSSVDDAACVYSCFNLLHETNEPVDGCPLTESVLTGRRTERIVSDDKNGLLRVSVSPLDLTDRGARVFLHLLLPLD